MPSCASGIWRARLTADAGRFAGIARWCAHGIPA